MITTIIISGIITIHLTCYWLDQVEFKKEAKRRKLYYRMYGHRIKKSQSFKTK